ncbi:unnamed protein product [Lepeophtheirus salmonis]|uniref:(salmon louse) hypothetical protein n=1 Tax=Lepeophtheirus salmonis TaxID=72036 RepID=A0A7R8D2L5_LEPSM|nr:unnamed protein product [Lepeophtheirus salmonis]CAF3006074.1 unnamed protein product [Lepeophtheirus salmonis]
MYAKNEGTKNHPKCVITFSNVKAVFFPPNTTSHLQPMDAGIIQNVKLVYKMSMLRSILVAMDDCNTASELTKNITILDAIHWLENVWMRVEEATISKLYLKEGL